MPSKSKRDPLVERLVRKEMRYAGSWSEGSAVTFDRKGLRELITYVVRETARECAEEANPSIGAWTPPGYTRARQDAAKAHTRPLRTGGLMSNLTDLLHGMACRCFDGAVFFVRDGEVVAEKPEQCRRCQALALAEAMEKQLSEEKARADSNFAAYGRVKAKYSEEVNAHKKTQMQQEKADAFDWLAAKQYACFGRIRESECLGDYIQIEYGGFAEQGKTLLDAVKAARVKEGK